MFKVLFLLAVWNLFSNTGAQKSLGCADGWYNANKKCYMFVNWKKTTWSQAEQECNTYDSALMYFDNADEVNWYKSYVQNSPAPEYWTSLNDLSWRGQNQAGTGHWKWGGYSPANMNFLQWNKSPANDGVNNCGAINVQGNMSDVGCNSTQGYICNVELSGGKCPDSTWTQTPTDCYYVSNTSDVSQLMTWSQAKAKCASLGSGSHLLTVDDANDQAFLQNALPFVTQSTYLFWTGLQYKGNSWQWFNGATFSQQFFKWTMEPDNLAGKEDCVVVRYNGQISDRGCTMLNNYICKKNQDHTDNTLNTGCGIWIRGGKKCYTFYTNPKSTWTDAKKMCQSSNGDLLNVKDLDTKTWLTEQMLDPSNDFFFWTSLNDRDQEGTYKWSDGSSLDANVIAWNAEPNDWRGNEDCATVFPKTFAYNDASCQFHAAPICEVDNVQSCPTKGGQWVSRNADTGSGYNCYLFGDYSNSDNLKTKVEALRFCQSLAMTGSSVPQLLSVNTAAEKQFLKTQASKYSDNAVGFWTMLTDASHEGYWSWGGNSTDTSLVDWIKEPQTDPPTADCAAVAYNGYFFMQDCSTNNGFICERSVYQPWNSAASIQSTVSILLSLVAVSGIFLQRLV